MKRILLLCDNATSAIYTSLLNGCVNQSLNLQIDPHDLQMIDTADFTHADAVVIVPLLNGAAISMVQQKFKGPVMALLFLPAQIMWGMEKVDTSALTTLDLPVEADNLCLHIRRLLSSSK